MQKISKSKIDRFVKTVERNEFTPERKEKALRFIKDLPLSQENISSMKKVEDDEIVSAAIDKHTQVLFDVVGTFEDAVKNGIDNLDDLMSWMGISQKDAFKETFNDILDTSHIYKITAAPEPVSYTHLTLPTKA